MKLIVEPRVVKTRQCFLDDAPSHSIALDWYVFGAPKSDLWTKHFNFNHHEELYRLMTRSTASQVHMAVKMGLMDCLKLDNTPYVNMYVNDPDQDSCLAVRLLYNYERYRKNKSEPLINKMIDIQDKLDTTAWLYPFDGETRTIMKLNWVFEPYTNAKIAWLLSSMDAHTMKELIEMVCNRITEYTLGNAELLESKDDYQIIWWAKDWKMIIEHWIYARNKLSADNVTAFVSYFGERGGKYYYSIGKKSEFVDFPIEELYHCLNTIEWCEAWGGSGTIGGCRNLGSMLSPKELELCINAFLEHTVNKTTIVLATVG